jgi:hypothetical protein
MLPAFPQGLKPKFVLWHLRHATPTQRVPRYPGRALSKPRLNQRFLKSFPANPMWNRREGNCCRLAKAAIVYCLELIEPSIDSPQWRRRYR